MNPATTRRDEFAPSNETLEARRARLWDRAGDGVRIELLKRAKARRTSRLLCRAIALNGWIPRALTYLVEKAGMAGAYLLANVWGPWVNQLTMSHVGADHVYAGGVWTNFLGALGTTGFMLGAVMILYIAYDVYVYAQPRSNRHNRGVFNRFMRDEFDLAADAHDADYDSELDPILAAHALHDVDMDDSQNGFGAAFGRTWCGTSTVLRDVPPAENKRHLLRIRLKHP